MATTRPRRAGVLIPTFAIRTGSDLGIGDTGGRLRAPVDDIILFTRHWGFLLREVTPPVKWWHGDADHIVPLSHGRHCVERLPNAELFIRPGESHLGGFAAAEEVLETLLATWDRKPVKEAL